MSFSGTVKEELARQKLGARHCQIAEITAIISMCGGISVSKNDRFLLKIQTENLFVARKYFTLLQKTFNIEVELSIRQHHGSKNGRMYHLYVKKTGRCTTDFTRHRADEARWRKLYGSGR